MVHQQIALPAGLYLVATPIGSARDITLRALDVLASADVLVAEDTRVLKRLLGIHGITLGERRVLAYHDHSSERDRDRIIAEIRAGRAVAYASDAGTPLIADPGFQLTQSAHSAGLPVTALPGPNAAINAMVLSGLPSDHFQFVGFLPRTPEARIAALQGYAQSQATLIAYETAARMAPVLDAIDAVFGADHQIALCREMTKKFETIYRGTVTQIRTEITEDTFKGECVLVIAPKEGSDLDENTIDEALRNALLTMRVKDAANTVAGALNLPKRDIYQRALALQNAQKGDGA